VLLWWVVKEICAGSESVTTIALAGQAAAPAPAFASSSGGTALWTASAKPSLLMVKTSGQTSAHRA
jgi:hypothetical protein